MKYEFKLKDKIVTVQCKKAEFSALKQVIHKVMHLSSYVREYNGLTTDNKFTTYMVIGPGRKIDKVEEYNKAVDEFIGLFQGVIKPTEFLAICKKATEIFNTYIPVQDNRKTPEQAQADAKEYKRICAENEAKQEAEADKFHKRFCPVDPVDIKHKAVTLSVTFDDSDMMTDYYHPHGSIGCTMLLADVPFRNETEKLARQVLAKYPELAKLKWEWKTEKYSMGHGNYLISEYFDEWDKKAYDGRNKVRIRYEIQFNSYTKKLRPYIDYPGNVPTGATLEEREQAVNDTDKPTMTLNAERNGVEIRFPEKPSPDILDKLHESPFRYSRRQNMWYAKQNSNTIAFAERLTA